MEIRQLESFLCVAKTLNFSKAAEEINLSQPTISTHIRDLEEYLNVQLFVRSTKEVSLTKAGRNFLGYAQKILAVRNQALRNLKGENPNICGHINILSSTIPAQQILPFIITSFQKQWPNIIFHVEQTDSRHVERKMSSFRYDFGMVGTVPDSSRFIHYPVCDDELVLVLPNDTPESSGFIHEKFSEYITKAPLVMRESGSGTRAETEKIFSKNGINVRDLQIKAYFSDTQSILQAVSNGMGVSLVSKIAVSMYADAGLIKVVEMGNPLFRRQIHFLYNKELWLSPIQQAFCRQIRQFYRDGENL